MMMRFLALLLLVTPANAAQPADIAVALTDDLVEIDTGFSGAELTLFGAVTGVDDPQGKVDIISVVRGPETDFNIRRIVKHNLIWTPGAPHTVKGAPGLYLTNATRPINDIAPLPDQAAHGLGLDALPIRAGGREHGATDESESRLFAEAFLTEVEFKGLYRDLVGGVSFKKGALFSINIDLPATTPVGAYEVAVYLYRDGVLLGADSAKILVNKVGAERRIYDLAQKRPILYGLLCVALSLFAGWLAAMAFRK